MFEECSSLAELNAARMNAVKSGYDLVEVNNAFNDRRTKLMDEGPKGIVLNAIHIRPREVVQYCGVPVCGRSSEPGVIALTPNGFLY